MKGALNQIIFLLRLRLLYRDNGLSIFKNCSGLQMEQIKKHLQKVFKNTGLDVIECNMKVVNIIRQIPKTVEKCLSQLSSNEEIFNKSAPFYEDKLHQYGYQQKLKYNPVNTKTHSKRNRKRNIIWFNTPFNRNVSTKIGKYFLNLLDKYCPRNHHLHKIFNGNSIKISYSSTKNMKTIINNHNKNILGKKPLIDRATCNC